MTLNQSEKCPSTVIDAAPLACLTPHPHQHSPRVLGPRRHVAEEVVGGVGHPEGGWLVVRLLAGDLRRDEAASWWGGGREGEQTTQGEGERSWEGGREWSA